MKLTLRDMCNVLLGDDKTKAGYIYKPNSMNAQLNKKRDVTVTIKTVITLQENETLQDIIDGAWIVVNVQEKAATTGTEKVK